ncbi:MAG TPA: hypothetical protein VI387_11560, partial [Candidatus Brocadiales bacterium]|nr:hypothetical protein [Candidatus Brocadiales bacterium]
LFLIVRIPLKYQLPPRSREISMMGGSNESRFDRVSTKAIDHQSISKCVTDGTPMDSYRYGLI